MEVASPPQEIISGMITDIVVDSSIEPVPLCGGPTDVSKRELDLWRNAQHDDSMLSICLQAGDISVYADKLKIMAWHAQRLCHT